MKNKIFAILFGIIAIGVGIFLIVSGNGKSKRCTSEAVGTVTQVIEEKEENIETEDDEAIVQDTTYTYTYYPVIEYSVGDKTLNEKYETGYGDKNKYKIGDKVDILYNPDKTEEYLIKSDKSSNIVGIVFIAAGVIIAIVGAIKKF